MFTKFTKIMKTAALLALAAFCFTGCFPTGEKTAAENAQYAELKKRADNIGNFKLELQLPENMPESAPTVKLTMREFNVDDIYETFGDGGSLISSEEYPSDYYLDSVYHVDKLDSVVTLIYERGRLSMSRFLDSDDGSAASQKNSEYCLMGELMEGYFFDDPRATGDIDGFSKEDAMKRANEIFDKLGIKIYDKPEIFKLSTELIKEKLDYIMDPVPDAYYLVYPAVIDDIPTLTKRADIKMGLSLAISPIKIIISKDRVEDFLCWHLYDNDYEITGESPIKFNAVEALEVLVSYYESQKLTDEIGFTSCELVYVPTARSEDVKSVEYKPAWLFSGYKKLQYTNTINKYELVYADTGARAVTG